MRPTLLPSLFCAATLLTSCAYEGVVVQKTSHPQPFYLTHGVGETQRFGLRGQAGGEGRQIVTPEVFDRYTEGDYFNDQQAKSTGDGKSTVERSARRSTRNHAKAQSRVAAKQKQSRHVAAHSRSTPSDSKEMVRETTTTTAHPEPQFVFVTDSSPARPILLNEPEIGVVLLARVR